MKIIILGTRGFIGCNLLDYFLSKGFYDVIGFSSGECNLLSMDSVQKKLSFAAPDDVIIMTSSITRLKENSFDSMVMNLRMAENIAKFIEANTIGYLVYLSTVDVYGLVKEGTVINEYLQPNPNDFYAISKLVGEYILKKTLHSRNIPILILRLSGIYGKGDKGKSTLNKIVGSALINKEVTIMGSGTDKRDFVYVEDLCIYIEEAIRQKFGGILNIATGTSYTIAQIVDAVRTNAFEEFEIRYKDENNSEKRVKELVFDVQKLRATFPKIKTRDLKEVLPLYISNFKG